MATPTHASSSKSRKPIFVRKNTSLKVLGVSEICIRDFKGLQLVKHSNLTTTQQVLLTGPYNSGKSRTLQAIHLLIDAWRYRYPNKGSKGRMITSSELANIDPSIVRITDGHLHPLAIIHITFITNDQRFSLEAEFERNEYGEHFFSPKKGLRVPCQFRSVLLACHASPNVTQQSRLWPNNQSISEWRQSYAGSNLCCLIWLLHRESFSRATLHWAILHYFIQRIFPDFRRLLVESNKDEVTIKVQIGKCEGNSELELQGKQFQRCLWMLTRLLLEHLLDVNTDLEKLSLIADDAFEGKSWKKMIYDKLRGKMPYKTAQGDSTTITPCSDHIMMLLLLDDISSAPPYFLKRSFLNELEKLLGNCSILVVGSSSSSSSIKHSMDCPNWSIVPLHASQPPTLVQKSVLSQKSTLVENSHLSQATEKASSSTQLDQTLDLDSMTLLTENSYENALQNSLDALKIHQIRIFLEENQKETSDNTYNHILSVLNVNYKKGYGLGVAKEVCSHLSQILTHSRFNLDPQTGFKIKDLVVNIINSFAGTQQLNDKMQIMDSILEIGFQLAHDGSNHRSNNTQLIQAGCIVLGVLVESQLIYRPSRLNDLVPHLDAQHLEYYLLLLQRAQSRSDEARKNTEKWMIKKKFTWH